MLTSYQCQKIARGHAAIKAYYLRGHSEAEWAAITQNPKKFNRVWRQMLKLPPDDTPPPKAYRD